MINASEGLPEGWAPCGYCVDGVVDRLTPTGGAVETCQPCRGVGAVRVERDNEATPAARAALMFGETPPEVVDEVHTWLDREPIELAPWQRQYLLQPTEVVEQVLQLRPGTAVVRGRGYRADVTFVDEVVDYIRDRTVQQQPRAKLGPCACRCGQQVRLGDRFDMEAPRTSRAAWFDLYLRGHNPRADHSKDCA